MTENNINRNTDYTDSNISNIINNISIIKIKELSFQKLKTRSTSIITYSSTNEIRKDIFGEEIKKGGKQRISFADNILLKDDIINKNCENITRNKLDNFVEIIDVISYKKENKLNYYKSNSIASYDDEICCESCIIY
jgi:hypothetical protein